MVTGTERTADVGALGTGHRTCSEESKLAGVGSSLSPVVLLPKMHWSRPGAGVKPRPERVSVRPPLTGPIFGATRLSVGTAFAFVRVRKAPPGDEKRRPSTETRRSTVCDGCASASGEAHDSSLAETKVAVVGPSAPNEQRISPGASGAKL